MSDKKVENLIINKLTKEQYKSLENKSDTELYVITDEEHLTPDEVQDLLQKKVDKVEGKSLISDTEIERLSKVDNYDDTEVKQNIAANKNSIESNKNSIETNKNNIEKNVENISKNASDINSLQTDVNDLQTNVTDLQTSTTDLQTGVTDLQNNKQDKLTAGTGIEITDNVISNTQTSAEWGNIKGDISQQNDLTNVLDTKSNISEAGNSLSYNDSLLSLQNKEGNTLSSVTIKSTPDTDNKTIHLNENNQIEAIGVTTKSDTLMVNWEGTLEEYESGLIDGSIDPEWFCYITDDEETVSTLEVSYNEDDEEIVFAPTNLDDYITEIDSINGEEI